LNGHPGIARARAYLTTAINRLSGTPERPVDSSRTAIRAIRDALVEVGLLGLVIEPN